MKYLCDQDRRAGAKWAENPSCSPESVGQPYLRLGTHPNVVTRLWNNFAAALPTHCNWVVYGNPALVNPESAVVFAFGAGTVYAFRLPSDARSEAVELGLSTAQTFSNGTTVNLADIGDEWLFGHGLSEEKRWCVRAFEHAGK